MNNMQAIKQQHILMYNMRKSLASLKLIVFSYVY